MPRDDERDNNTPAEDIYKTLYLYLFYLQDSRSRRDNADEYSMAASVTKAGSSSASKDLRRVVIDVVSDTV